MKHHFLFGSDICRELNDGGIKAAVKYAKNDSGFGLFIFEDGITTPFELLEAAQGWDDYACLDEKELKRLEKI